MKRLLLAGIFVISMVGCAGGAAYYANVPPPPIRAENYGPAPGPGFTYVGGYWAWRGRAYDWVPGRWVRPPRPRSVWVAPYWEHRGGRYRLHEGHWR